MRGTFHGGLLEYYQRELRFLRDQGAAFARKYPKVASRLQFGAQESPDPHVERLIESFAFLTGRIQYGIDSEFPLIPSALLGILYPHLLQPVPSMSIARVDPDPDLGEMTGGFRIPRLTQLFTETEEGATCRFRTTAEVRLWPVRVAEAGIESADQYDFLDNSDVTSVLRIRIDTTGRTGLGDLDMQSLRLHIAGEVENAGNIYELLFSAVDQIAVVADGNKEAPFYIGAESINPVGFAADEAILPHPDTAHPGYRLIQEYFTFPQKFLFFDLAGLAGHGAEKRIDVLFLLKTPPRKAVHVAPENFLLGCTPIVNLFPRTSEPIRIDHSRTQYRLVPDTRWERTTEIHTVLSVSAAADAREESRELRPYFSFDHAAIEGDPHAFWYATREESNRADMPGTSMQLNFVDLDFEPSQPAQTTVYAHTLCTNRQLADQVPPNAVLHIEQAGPVARIACLFKPTTQILPPIGGPALWRLVSHLSVNYLSLAEGGKSLPALQEILRLYASSTHASIEQQIQGIRTMACEPIVRRVGSDAWRGFCRGTKVTLGFDERMYVGGSAFLMGAVLNRFLGLYVSINSFTQLVMVNGQRPDEDWKQWLPVGGEQIVL